MSVDKLFEVRNNFYLGSFQQCINEAQKLSLKGPENELKEAFLYRAYIALGKASVALNEIKEKVASPLLLSVRRYADFVANPAKRAAIVSAVENEVQSGTLKEDETSHVLAATILIAAGNNEEALRALHSSEGLEARSVAVQALLKLDRVDLAVKEQKKLAEVDEDATLTQLALASVNQALGKEKLKDAFYIYQEQLDKHGPSALLLVAQASTLILQHKFEDAEKLLLDAQQRDPNNAEALINLVVVGEHLGKAKEVMARYTNQLKESFPDHPWTRDLLNKEKAFDRLVGSQA